MDFYYQYDVHLSAEERAHVAKARAFCAGAFSESVFAAHVSGDAFPQKWIADWAALGMLGLQAKRAHGGLEASYLCKVRVAQEMAHHGFAAAFCLNHHQGGATRLSQTGTSIQIERLLQPALRGELLLTTAMTEPAGGSDVSALTTTAVPVNGGWALSGTKAWMTDGLLVGGLIVLARVGDAAGTGEIASFYVPFGQAETVKRTEIVVPGARSFRLAEVVFDAHFIPEWCLIAAPGAALKASMASVNAARVHVAAMCVATLHAALCEAVEYCERRQAFGKPLTGHQACAGSWRRCRSGLRPPTRSSSAPPSKYRPGKSGRPRCASQEVRCRHRALGHRSVRPDRGRDGRRRSPPPEHAFRRGPDGGLRRRHQRDAARPGRPWPVNDVPQINPVAETADLRCAT